MTAPQETITGAVFLDAPRDKLLQELYAYWDTLRGSRMMPSRADFDPTRIPKLLPHIIMYNVEAPGGPYVVRLVGEEVQRFVGRNTTGLPAGSIMKPQSAAIMMRIFDAVVSERAPKFRAGKAHWLEEKNYREFEACFLPLSSDGETVNIILGAVRFPL